MPDPAAAFARAQAAYDSATPDDLYVFDDDHDDGPDPDDARDRAFDAALASDWDDVPSAGIARDDDYDAEIAPWAGAA